VTPEQRQILFADVLNMPGDFALIVNHAWLEEHKTEASIGSPVPTAIE